MAKKSK